ncbi:MAG: hypothetical protein KDJ98_05930 [Rhodobacteraceae bacterium]|nr:hypothetical protein [Paracoccaceae bacterium]
MIAMIRDRVERFFGGGSASTSVPAMDGPLQPNTLLDAAPVLARAEGLDNLTVIDGVLHASAGADLLRIGAEGPQVIESFSAPITCLAAASGRLAIGLEGHGVLIRQNGSETRVETLGGAPFLCPTAALFLGDGALVVASGARDLPPSEWKRDLMSHGHSGSVWRIAADGAQTRLADRLAWPCGLAETPDGTLWVSEAWRHRVLRIGAGPVLDDLPGYPGRLIPAQGGGYFLALFAPRNQMIEFVLREKGFRTKMMAELDPDHWVAPALASRDLIREPLLGGGVRQMGILKPWAPSKSYGLVIRLDAAGQPIASWHSRADGKRHGVTSLAEQDGRLVVGAQGAGEAVTVDPMPAIRWEQAV